MKILFQIVNQLLTICLLVSHGFHNMHDMGLIGYYIFFAIKGGTTYGFSPIDFIIRPSLWLETISKYKGTASSAPNFAFEYCLRPGKIDQDTFNELDLSSLRFLMTAAEPIDCDIYEQFKPNLDQEDLPKKRSLQHTD